MFSLVLFAFAESTDACSTGNLNFTVPGEGGLPGIVEGVCYDSTRELFYVGNIFGTTIYSVDPSDCSTQTWQGPYDGGTFGCYYNAALDKVYSTNSQGADLFLSGINPTNVSRIIATDLASSTVSVAGVFPNGIFMNDLFVNDDGSLVATDFLGNMIYYVNSTGGIEHEHTTSSPNGIRPLTTNTFLVGKDMLTKITMGDTWTEHTVNITNSDVMLASYGQYDGMEFLSDGTLVANLLAGDAPSQSQVCHLTSSDDWMTATVIGIANGPAAPYQWTTLAVDGDDNVYALSTDFTGSSTEYFISMVEFEDPSTSSAYAAGASVLATALFLMA